MVMCSFNSVVSCWPAGAPENVVTAYHVLLVFQQSSCSSLRVGLIANCRNDVVARPDDMVGPQLAHVLFQGDR